MKSTSLAAALFVAAALGASVSFAVVVMHGERDLGWEQPQASSSLTREDVRAEVGMELKAAKKPMDSAGPGV